MRGRAFGLELEATFSLPGLGPAASSPGPGTRPPAALTRTTRRALLARWPADDTTVADRRGHRGRKLLEVRAHPEAGYLMTASGWGRYRIAPGAAAIEAAPVPAAAWRWQRFLIGQVLPFAAVVRGYEAFHASVMAWQGPAAAFLGGSGAGKSTTALALLAAGWEFLADDVAVVGRDGAGIVVHPGTGILSVRAGTAVPGLPDPAAVGTVLGRDDDAARVEVRVRTEPRPLVAMYFVERAPAGGGPRIEPLRPVDPRLLLGASFNLLVQTPERLARQLDVCAAVSASTLVSRLAVPAGCPAPEVAGLITEHSRQW